MSKEMIFRAKAMAQAVKLAEQERVEQSDKFAKAASETASKLVELGGIKEEDKEVLVSKLASDSTTALEVMCQFAQKNAELANQVREAKSKLEEKKASVPAEVIGTPDNSKKEASVGIQKSSNEVWEKYFG